MERVLSTTELLLTIFDHLPSPYYAYLVYVCKQWSDIALNLTWKVLHDVRKLLRLLAPLKSLGFYRGAQIYAFARPIRPEDWACFDKYSWRVRTVYFSDRYLHPSVFDDIVRSRPRGVLLPNLRKMECLIPLHIFSVFGNPSLPCLILQSGTHVFADIDRPFFEQTLLSLPTATPSLEQLAIYLGFWFLFSAEETCLITAIKKLPSLRFPCRWLTPGVTEAIAALPNLVTLDTFGRGAGPPSAVDNTLFSCSLQPSSFPNLEELCIHIQYHRLALSFSGPYSPSSLCSLTVTSQMTESSHDFAYLLEVISRSCAALKIIQLLDSPNPTITLPDKLVTMSQLSPLVSCSKLRVIDLVHTNPFRLYVEDIVSIVKALPYLTELRLYSHSKVPSPTLHLSVLSAIASLPNKLRFLDFEVDTTADHRLGVDDKVSFTTLCDLEILCIRTSPLSNPVPVATFLGRVLPIGCLIHQTDQLALDSPEGKQWDRVRELLPAFQAIHAEEKRHRQHRDAD